MRRLALFVSILLAAGQAHAQSAVRSHVEAAAVRFDLPAALIEAVIAAESDGDVRAVSSAGAMGLMQLMPGTWAQLRARLALGDDPFDPRDNIMAGSAYLRALHDRYGAPGFLAAYNAGPGRYEASLSGRPLPLETRRYVARVTGDLGAEVPVVSDWRVVGLFPSAWARSLGPSPEGVGEPDGPGAQGQDRALFVRRPRPGR